LPGLLINGVQHSAAQSLAVTQGCYAAGTVRCQGYELKSMLALQGVSDKLLVAAEQRTSFIKAMRDSADISDGCFVCTHAAGDPLACFSNIDPRGDKCSPSELDTVQTLAGCNPAFGMNCKEIAGQLLTHSCLYCFASADARGADAATECFDAVNADAVKVVSAITVDAELAQLQAGTAERVAFEVDFATDLAAALNTGNCAGAACVQAADIVVDSIVGGSVIVHYHIRTTQAQKQAMANSIAALKSGATAATQITLGGFPAQPATMDDPVDKPVFTTGPPSQQFTSCTMDTCCDRVYTWMMPDWPACATACGLPESQVTRLVQCIAGDGTQAPDASLTQPDQLYCAMDKPMDTLYCGATEPCRYHWHQTVPNCLDDCGLAERNATVAVECQDTDGAAQAAARCDGQLRPHAQYVCPANLPCKYVWAAQDFSPCPTKCGQPRRDAAVVCMKERQPGHAAQEEAQDFLCTTQRPPPCKACVALPAANSCAQTVACGYWSADPWPACPTECDAGASTQTRGLKCRFRSNGLEAKLANGDPDPSPCNNNPAMDGNKPLETNSCPATPACVTYKWQLGDVACPTDCGEPATTPDWSYRRCVGSDGEVQKDNLDDDYQRSGPTCDQLDWLTGGGFQPCRDSRGTCTIPTDATTKADCNGATDVQDNALVQGQVYTIKAGGEGTTDWVSVGLTPTNPTTGAVDQGTDANAPGTCTNPPTATTRATCNGADAVFTAKGVAGDVFIANGVQETGAGFGMTNGVVELKGVFTPTAVYKDGCPWTESCAARPNVRIGDFSDSTLGFADDVADFEACRALCDEVAQCGAATYVSGESATNHKRCYFKSIIGDGRVSCTVPVPRVDAPPTLEDDCAGDWASAWQTLIGTRLVQDTSCTSGPSHRACMPLGTKSCPAPPACPPRWVSTPCPSLCGQPDQVPQEVKCMRGNVEEVEANCPGARPVNTCPATPACAKWHEGDWGDCDTGPCRPLDMAATRTSHSRPVTCQQRQGGNAAGTWVDTTDAVCDNLGLEKPATTEFCPWILPCTYSWHTGDFGACPTECDAPEVVLTRTVTCFKDEDWDFDTPGPSGSTQSAVGTCLVGYDTNGATGAKVPKCPPYADTPYCDLTPKPSETHTCPAKPKCTYAWIAPAYEACPFDCDRDASTRTRVIGCMKDEGDAVQTQGTCRLNGLQTAAVTAGTCTGAGAAFTPTPNGPPDTTECEDPDRGAGEKPGEALQCAKTNICMARWEAADFPPCPATCDLPASTQTRAPACKKERIVARTCDGAEWAGTQQACLDASGTCTNPPAATTRAACDGVDNPATVGVNEAGVFTSNAAYAEIAPVYVEVGRCLPAPRTMCRQSPEGASALRSAPAAAHRSPGPTPPSARRRAARRRAAPGRGRAQATSAPRPRTARTTGASRRTTARTHVASPTRATTQRARLPRPPATARPSPWAWSSARTRAGAPAPGLAAASLPQCDGRC
jgi:hypothetical protein